MQVNLIRLHLIITKLDVDSISYYERELNRANVQVENLMEIMHQSIKIALEKGLVLFLL